MTIGHWFAFARTRRSVGRRYDRRPVRSACGAFEEHADAINVGESWTSGQRIRLSAESADMIAA
jgi:hypothetical protein